MATYRRQPKSQMTTHTLGFSALGAAKGVPTPAQKTAAKEAAVRHRKQTTVAGLYGAATPAAQKVFDRRNRNLQTALSSGWGAQAGIGKGKKKK